MKPSSTDSSTGAVYSNIKLTNAIDEAMISRGVLAPQHLRQHEERALADTGAVHLVISQQIS